MPKCSQGLAQSPITDCLKSPEIQSKARNIRRAVKIPFQIAYTFGEKGTMIGMSAGADHAVTGLFEPSLLEMSNPNWQA